MKIAVPLAKNILAPLGITATARLMLEFKRKYMAQGQPP